MGWEWVLEHVEAVAVKERTHGGEGLDWTGVLDGRRGSGGKLKKVEWDLAIHPPTRIPPSVDNSMRKKKSKEEGLWAARQPRSACAIFPSGLRPGRL